MQLFCYLRGLTFCIHNFNFKKSQNLVQISFKLYFKNLKNFLIKYNVKFLKPPSYVILKSKNRLKTFPQIWPQFCSDLPWKIDEKL